MFWFFGREECGILVPRSGIEPVCLALKVQCLSHWTAREVLLAPLFMPGMTFRESHSCYYVAIEKIAE